MAAFNKFNIFVEDLAEKVHSLSSDSLKIMLTNTAPSATNNLLADLVEITAANGYVAGGNVITITSSGQTSGTYKLVLADTTFTAAGGSIGPFRYAVLYNNTPTANSQGTTGKPLIGWWDYGSSITLANTETFTVDFDPTTGALQLV